MDKHEELDRYDIEPEELTQEEQEYRDQDRLHWRELQNEQLFNRLRQEQEED